MNNGWFSWKCQDGCGQRCENENPAFSATGSPSKRQLYIWAASGKTTLNDLVALSTYYYSYNDCTLGDLITE